MARMRCPREGLRVCLRANPAGMMMYTHAGDPRSGDCGETVTVPVPGGRKTCMPGPGGGLVYVRWDSGHVAGVFKGHLVSGGGKALAGGKRRRKARR